MSDKRRDVLNSRAREMLINVNDYFEKEKEQCKDIVKTLNCLLKGSADKPETVISRQLLMEIIHHLKKNNNVTDCVVKATGVNKNTVCTVRGERAEAVATNSGLKSPIKKARGNKQFLDSFGLLALRNIIHSFYIDKREVPTLKKILELAQRDLHYTGSKSTLRRILMEELGYSFKKCSKD